MQMGGPHAWSVSQPICGSPVLASMFPSIPYAEDTCRGRNGAQIDNKELQTRVQTQQTSELSAARDTIIERQNSRHDT